MEREEKLELLVRSIWTKKEAREYSGLNRNYLTKMYKKCQHPSFRDLIFRDKFLKELGTNVEKEMKFLKGGNEDFR